MDPVLLLILGIVVILVIIAFNGFFVAQEFAYMSVDRVRLKAAAARGDAAAERALSITRRTSFMLSGAQLGITVTGLLVGYVAEPMVGAALTELLGGTSIPREVVIAVSTVGVLLVATVVQMIIGELYPKNLAIANPEPLARVLARPSKIYLALFGWLIWFFDKSAEALLRLLRIEPVHDVDSTATAQDLDRIVEDSRDSGSLPADLSVLIDRILDFPEQDAEHAMIPRSQVDEVRPDTTVREVRALMAVAHTRYPVVSEEHEPLGVVHLQDVLAHAGDDDAAVTALMRPAVIVPTVMPLPDVTTALDAEDEELACVIDEHGGFVGVLTLEDLAEELVGDVRDEHDDEIHEQITVLEEGARWSLRADVHLDELERTVGHPLPEGEAETVSGLLIEVLGRLPEEGERVHVDLPEDTRDYGGDEVYDRRLDVLVRTVERHVPADVEVLLVETPAEGKDRGPEDDAHDDDAAAAAEEETR